MRDGLRGARQVSHRGGGRVLLYEGAEVLRAATDDERLSLPVRATWGLRVLALEAEALLVRSHARR